MAKGIYALTFFAGHMGVIPTGEFAGLTAAGIIERVAPEDGPQILTDKALALHFITSPLREAPYVAKTALRFPTGAIGRQRSGSHVIEGAWFPFDVDDISADDKAAILSGLAGKVYAAYSTFNHGREAGKVRMRVLLFADRALAPTDWTRAWHVIDCALFDGKADKRTTKLHQLAAVWAAHPERVSQSFRHVGVGLPLCADELLALAPKPKAPAAQFVPMLTTPSALRSKYEAALRMLDAGDYADWAQIGYMALCAAVELRELSEPTARDVWLTWSDTAPATRRAHNDDARYSPDVMWQRRPTLTRAPGSLTGTLFRKACDRAVKIAMAKCCPQSERVRAEQYLADHHKKLYAHIRAAT